MKGENILAATENMALHESWVICSEEFVYAFLYDTQYKLPEHTFYMRMQDEIYGYKILSRAEQGLKLRSVGRWKLDGNIWNKSQEFSTEEFCFTGDDDPCSFNLELLQDLDLELAQRNIRLGENVVSGSRKNFLDWLNPQQALERAQAEASREKEIEQMDQEVVVEKEKSSPAEPDQALLEQIPSKRAEKLAEDVEENSPSVKSSKKETHQERLRHNPCTLEKAQSKLAEAHQKCAKCHAQENWKGKKKWSREIEYYQYVLRTKKPTVPEIPAGNPVLSSKEVELEQEATVHMQVGDTVVPVVCQEGGSGYQGRLTRYREKRLSQTTKPQSGQCKAHHNVPAPTFVSRSSEGGMGCVVASTKATVRKPRKKRRKKADTPSQQKPSQENRQARREARERFQEVRRKNRISQKRVQNREIEEARSQLHKAESKFFKAQKSNTNLVERCQKRVENCQALLTTLRNNPHEKLSQLIQMAQNQLSNAENALYKAERQFQKRMQKQNNPQKLLQKIRRVQNQLAREEGALSKVQENQNEVRVKQLRKRVKKFKTRLNHLQDVLAQKQYFQTESGLHKAKQGNALILQCQKRLEECRARCDLLQNNPQKELDKMIQSAKNQLQQAENKLHKTRADSTQVIAQYHEKVYYSRAYLIDLTSQPCSIAEYEPDEVDGQYDLQDELLSQSRTKGGRSGGGKSKCKRIKRDPQKAKEVSSKALKPSKRRTKVHRGPHICCPAA